MKTAVEYLLEELKELGALHIDGLHWSDQDDVKKSINQAKEMEEEQMIAFAKKCIHKALESDILMAYNQVEQYYNETFKQEQ